MDIYIYILYIKHCITIMQITDIEKFIEHLYQFNAISKLKIIYFFMIYCDDINYTFSLDH